MSSSPVRKTPARRVAMIDIPDAPFTAMYGEQEAEGHEAVMPLAIALARQGHAVDVYRIRRGPAQPAWEDVHAGVRVHRIGVPALDLDLDLAPELLSQAIMAFSAGVKRTALGSWPCDTVHAWGALGGLAGLRVTTGRALPLIWSPGRSLSLAAAGVDGALGGIVSVLVRRADALLCTSDGQREQMVRQFDALQGRVKVVARGCDTAVFRPRARGALRQVLGLPTERLMVLWGSDNPSAYRPFLRVLQKLQACTVVRSDRRCAEPAADSAFGLRCLPDGAGGMYGQALRSALYAAADVMVLPGAHWDPEQLCPRESMACGTPVLVLPAPGDDDLRSLVADGAAGRMLPRARADALYDALHGWPRHPRAAAALDMGCLLRARTFFTWTRAAEQTMAVYEAARRPAANRDDCRPLTLVRSLPRVVTLHPAGVGA